MFGCCLTRTLLGAVCLSFAVPTHMSGTSNPFSCKGGSIYFAAHPVDVLLYQNPDIFHGLYVYKCTTTVLFTSGDRGFVGNYSRSVERGFEAAFAYMTAQPADDNAWETANVQFNGKVVLLRTLKDSPHVQVVYLRLPNGTPDGEGYAASEGESLKKLYNKEIGSLSATDESATYTLDSLKDLISAMLEKRKATAIRVLDYKTPIPKDREDKDREHADHSVSARLVAEVVEQDNIKATLRGYACGSMRSLQPTLDALNLSMKAETYFQYAKYDDNACKDYGQCLPDAEYGSAKSMPDNDDTNYVPEWLEREYYVQ